MFLLLTSFLDEFESQYKDALTFVDNNYRRFSETFNAYQIDQDIAISIVFPELIRYSYFRDFFETKTLSILYVKGKNVDFSIGQFQMKPSFIEKLESEIKNNPSLSRFKEIAIYSAEDSISVRKERVERLSSTEWQLKYLCCFYEIMENKVQSNTLSQEEKLKLYATAYNYNFQKSIDEIKKWNGTKSFPFGMKAPPHIQYAYSEVSYFFYKNDLNQIKSKYHEEN